MILCYGQAQLGQSVEAFARLRGTCMKVAILDDDQDIRGAVSGLLEQSGYSCTSFDAGRAMLRALHRDSFDLFVVDWNLPDLSGLHVIEWIRNQLGAQPPVLLLTSRDTEEDTVAALKAGADDFVTKPFQPAVLMARVDALARRSAAGQSQASESYGEFRFDLATKVLHQGRELIRLTPKEFTLALLLFRNLNRAVARSYILETIWGMDPDLPTRTLDIHVSKIRSKLALRAGSGYRLAPVYGYGYRLEATRT